MTDRLTQFVALIVLGAGLIAAFMLTPSINRQRVERQLTYDLEGGSAADPVYTFLAASGAFRGIVINALWQRSEALKQEGKFFEANQSAQLITSLQPRYPEAWSFQGWNMAYNISVKCKTAEERWDWVNKGMTLLRDRGIPNNPNAVVLYRSLAWIMGHKMTGETDDMHKYYKSRTAENWQTLLGIPDPRWALKPEFSDPANRPAREDLDPLKHGTWLATEDFASIVEAAETYFRKPGRPGGDDYSPANYFTALSPEALARFYEANPALEPLVEELKAVTGPDGEPLGLGLNTKTLRAIGRLKMYLDAGFPINSPAVFNEETLGSDAMGFSDWEKGRRSAKQSFNLTRRRDLEAARQTLQQRDPEAEIVDLLPMLDLLRAQAIIAEYNMDPAFMLSCMETYGPLDWRIPASHACYWTALGTLRAEAWTLDKERVDFINANRALIHSLQHLTHQGKINYRPKVAALGPQGRESINNTPDTRFIPAYEAALDAVLAKLEAGELGDGHSKKTYETGHENFLQAATYLYFFEERTDLAQAYFDKCKRLYKDNTRSSAARKGHYNLSLSDFAAVTLFEDEQRFVKLGAIDFWIVRAWKQGIAKRDQGEMLRYLRLAKQRYDAFQEDRQSHIKADADAQTRQGLPPFEDLVLFEFVTLMGSAEYSLPQKSALWQIGAPLLAGLSQDRPLLFEAYNAFLPIVTNQAVTEGWFTATQPEDLVREMRGPFPEPRGFREWYEATFNQGT